MSGYGQYQGPERRRRKVFVTKNTEYHFDGDTCIAVRDRGTGRFLLSHLALNRKLSGAIDVLDNGTPVPSTEPPSIGQALYFGSEGRELVTSLCSRIERPEKYVVQNYP